MRARDIALERRLTDTAAKAAGLPGDGGLWRYANQRAHPGGVRADMDYDEETRQELADACNYLVWGIEPVYASLGSGQFVDDYERYMRALSRVALAWHELHRRSA
jgi:hypothetical protein